MCSRKSCQRRPTSLRWCRLRQQRLKLAASSLDRKWAAQLINAPVVSLSCLLLQSSERASRHRRTASAMIDQAPLALLFKLAYSCRLDNRISLVRARSLARSQPATQIIRCYGLSRALDGARSLPVSASFECESDVCIFHSVSRVDWFA